MNSRNIKKLSELISVLFHIISFIAVIVMMLLVVANIIGRIFFQHPVMGTIEITGFAGVVFVSVAIGFAERENRNVYVDLFTSKFSPIVRYITDIITSLLSLIIICILFWATAQSAYESYDFEEITVVMELKTYPFQFFWSLGILILGLFLVQTVFQNLLRRPKK